MVVCTFNLSTWEADAGGSLRVQGYFGLYEFQNSQSNILRPYLKTKTKTNTPPKQTKTQTKQNNKTKKMLSN